MRTSSKYSVAGRHFLNRDWIQSIAPAWPLKLTPIGSEIRSMHAAGIQSAINCSAGDHRLAVHGDRVGRIVLDVVAARACRRYTRSIDRCTSRTSRSAMIDEQVDQALRRSLRQASAGVELAGPQRAVARAIEHRAQTGTRRTALGSRDDLRRRRPRCPSPDSGQLSSWRMPTTWPGIARAEVVQRVVARHAGHAGDQQRQRQRTDGRA